MKKNRFKIKRIFLVIMFPVIFFFFDIFTREKTSYYEEELNYINSLNIFLNGKVMDIYKLDYGHDYGIVTIDINESSIKLLDEREEKSRYLGLIKNELGYIVLGTISDFQLGDSIVIKSSVYDLYRNNRKIKNGRSIILPKDDVFKPYKEINRQLNNVPRLAPE